MDLFFAITQKFRWWHKSMTIKVEKDDDSKERALLKGCYDFSRLSSPIRFHEKKTSLYREKRDFACNIFGQPLLINDRFKAKLEAHGVTGWKSYPIVLVNKKGRKVAQPKYHGFTITGRCKQVNLDQNDDDITCATGIYLDPTTWDGSDIFMEERSWGFFIHQRVKWIFDTQNELEVIPASKAARFLSVYRYEKQVHQRYYQPKSSEAWRDNKEILFPI